MLRLQNGLLRHCSITHTGKKLEGTLLLGTVVAVLLQAGCADCRPMNNINALNDRIE